MKTTKAIYRATGGFTTFACVVHKSNLEQYEQQVSERESHLTEADHQTWLRL